MNKKRLFMIIAIALLTIGFAAVSTVLYINGTVTVKKDATGFVNGVMFDASSLSGTNIGTPTLSESGRTINFTVNDMSNVGDTATLKFKVRNNSQYNARLGNPAVSCYDVSSHTNDQASTSASANGYVTFTADSTLNGVLVNAGGGVTSNFGTITITQTKSYTGDSSKAVKFQCVLNISAEESTTPALSVSMIDAQSEVGKGAVGVFRSDAPLDTLQSVKVDGTVIDPSNYETASGSTIVRLSGDYTNTLASGKHTIEIVSASGSASAEFDIVTAITFSLNGVTYKTTPGYTFSQWIIETGGASTSNGIVWISPKNANSNLNDAAFQYGGVWYQYRNDIDNRLYEAVTTGLPTDPICMNDSANCNVAAGDIIQNNAVYGGKRYAEVNICCFDPDMRVLMADGTYKAIIDVKAGDMVMSLNEDTGEYIAQRVSDTIVKHNSDDLVYVYLSDGTRIGMRAYHPLLTTDGYKSLRPELAETRMEAGENVGLLKVGDTIVGINGNAKIVKIETRTPEDNYDTYNLSIEGYHNYIVEGYVVHNAGCKTDKD